jgi:pimeloyl-ACP methyl ester carboxylesterase
MTTPPAMTTGERVGRAEHVRQGEVWADIDEVVDEQAHSVLLIHGQPGSSLIWTGVRPLLRACGLQVLSIDRPGYGRASGEARNQFDNASAIAAILDEEHSEPTIVVGHSLGAGIALALAATAPHHVLALVLVAPAAGPSAITVTDRALAAPVLGAIASWLGFRTAGLALHIPLLRQRILTDRMGLSAADADEVVRRITRGPVWRSFTVEQRHLVADAHQIEQSLAGINCPAVVLAGTRDRIVRPRVVAALARQLPESALMTTDTGHIIPIDDPGAVVNAVLRALRWQYRNSLHDPDVSRTG